MSAAPMTNTWRYTVVVNYDADDDVYYATIPTLGIITQGESYEEAFWMAGDAINGWVADAQAHGDPIPAEDEDMVQVRRMPASLPE